MFGLVRWRPFESVVNRQDSFDGFVRDFFDSFPSVLETEHLAPAIDVAEENGHVVIRAEVPGIKKEDIDVSLRDGVLTLKGEKKLESDRKDRRYHRTERRYGAFSRSIALPEYVDLNKVDAQYKDGVLTITLDKKAEAKPKQIEIKAA